MSTNLDEVEAEEKLQRDTLAIIEDIYPNISFRLKEHLWFWVISVIIALSGHGAISLMDKGNRDMFFSTITQILLDPENFFRNQQNRLERTLQFFEQIDGHEFDGDRITILALSLPEEPSNLTTQDILRVLSGLPEQEADKGRVTEFELNSSRE